jgi:hypothetical protein
MIELMTPYLFSRGYNLNIDNLYSSPSVFQKLLEANKSMPAELKKQKLEKYAIATYCHKILAEKWQDNRPVTILTTIHDNTGMVKQRQAGEQGSQKTKACP